MSYITAYFLASLYRETDRAIPVDVAATLIAHGKNPFSKNF